MWNCVKLGLLAGEFHGFIVVYSHPSHCCCLWRGASKEERQFLKRFSGAFLCTRGQEMFPSSLLRFYFQVSDNTQLFWVWTHYLFVVNVFKSSRVHMVSPNQLKWFLWLWHEAVPSISASKFRKIAWICQSYLRYETFQREGKCTSKAE